MPTGYADLDKILMGLQPSDMIVLAARPSMGKTSLALNIAENIALGIAGGESCPVAVFSLEMSKEQLVRRMICSHARVPSHKLQGGYISREFHGQLIAAADALMKAPIFLDDTAGLEALELRSRARRIKRKHDIQLIVVDYLQMLSYPQFAREGRQRETAAISGALKAMAKELRIPVLVLSQLSRAPEQRSDDGKPRLSDLRDSGAIEQDADVVLMLRRPSVYAEEGEAMDEKLAEVEVAKHRNGPTGKVDFNFEREYTRFENRAPGVSIPARILNRPARGRRIAMKFRPVPVFLLAVFLLAVFALPAAALVVKEIRVETGGHGVADRESVLAYTSLKVGDEFSRMAVNRDVKALQKSGRYSSVSVDVDSLLGGVAVTYVVDPKLRIRKMEITGADYLGNKKVRDLLEMGVGDLVDDAALAVHAQKVRDTYKKKYFPYAKLTWTIEPMKEPGMAYCPDCR